ncbi:MAG: hypothetical protein ABIG95_04395 [Candidatus Woesearchaeota archaeon]
MVRGRPPTSEIRQNIVELLFFMGRAYGYEIYRDYIEIYPAVSRRSIYYQLGRGAELGLFKVERVVEKGKYSWGSESERLYYSLGPGAKPVGNARVREYVSLKFPEKAK